VFSRLLTQSRGHACSHRCAPSAPPRSRSKPSGGRLQISSASSPARSPSSRAGTPTRLVSQSLHLLPLSIAAGDLTLGFHERARPKSPAAS
jgi:hypothetical protein